MAKTDSEFAHSTIQKPVLVDSSKQPVIWNDLTGCADSLALANAARNNKNLLVIVCANNQTALRLEFELAFFLNKELPVLPFPNWETLPYDVFSPLPEIVSQRLETLAQLPQLNQGVLVVSIATLMQRLAPRSHILANTFSMDVGDKLEIESLRQQLEKVGYQCVPQVYQHGEFAVRGSIIDLFPMGSLQPYRIDLFDEEIETIRVFDCETQLSTGKAEQIRLFPAREFPFSDDSIKQFRQQFRILFPNISDRIPLFQDISKGITPGGVEYYLPLFVDQCESLFDYLPENSTIALMGDFHETAEHHYKEINERFEQRRHDQERPLLQPDALFLSPQDLFSKLEQEQRVLLHSNPVSSATGFSFATEAIPDVAIQSAKSQPGQALQKYLEGYSGKVLFIAETPGHREAMLTTLRKIDIKPKTVENWPQFLEGDAPIAITVAPLDHGVRLTTPDISIITESQLQGAIAQQRRRRRTSSPTRELENVINSLAELEEGSPVVHLDHGVGRYMGLKTIPVGEITTEFLTLEYANNDKLYVPVSALHLISRYTGATPESAPLHKLGSDQWSKAKKKAMSRVRDVAAELLDIQAKRAARPGRLFQAPENDISLFAAGFPFEETPDQQNAIDSIIEDLNSVKTMDRVVCGDVGFGKTEVAMRAAFVVVQNGSQVAVLVPTTLLAQQHYQNFRDRFADWPVRVEVISRFNSKKQQDEILADLAAGKVDILIGTHKLLQKGIEYKDLGLVIIDEEHRFGVNHKEHFKKLRSEVDLLTLTATPIPRTLNMAMSGLRDISIIATPPPNRHAIKTFVSEWVDSLVQEACLREIQRGGQLFFLHNDVKTMQRMADQLSTLIPEARIEIAHGQMPERELERIMLDFYHQRFNLLLCTTIVESGIDVPSANTIIINRADRLGLAQLHQLRGRVGRSHHRAYAYLLVPNKKVMTRDAIKRLEAIETTGDLGAGFMLSSHDLEIRGAGELLGDEQSGQIQEIGYGMYTELLERAVNALKDGKEINLDSPMESGPEVDLQIAALIPDDYLPDVHTRLTLYKRIASSSGQEDLDALQIEMIDRFGMLPDACKNLFAINELKLQASELGIIKIEASAAGGRLIFSEQPKINTARLIELLQTQPQIYKMDGPDKFKFIQPFDSAESKIHTVKQLMDELREEVANQ